MSHTHVLQKTVGGMELRAADHESTNKRIDWQKKKKKSAFPLAYRVGKKKEIGGDNLRPLANVCILRWCIPDGSFLGLCIHLPSPTTSVTFLISRFTTSHCQIGLVQVALLK